MEAKMKELEEEISTLKEKKAKYKSEVSPQLGLGKICWALTEYGHDLSCRLKRSLMPERNEKRISRSTAMYLP